MPSQAIPDVQEHYKSSTKIVDGGVGYLTTQQEQALKDLWTKIISHFESTASTPIAVTHDQ
ncbi:hypothetical protein EV174_005152, partial [Coemansia sp. RSA 2320]